MARTPQYDPAAILYQAPYKTDEGRLVLIGNDPTSEDATAFYEWPVVQDSWSKRESWRGKITDQHKKLSPGAGELTGWPGAKQVEPKPLGRPKSTKPAPEKRDFVALYVPQSIMRSLIKHAAAADQTIPEWCLQLIAAAVAPAHGETPSADA